MEMSKNLRKIQNTKVSNRMWTREQFYLLCEWWNKINLYVTNIKIEKDNIKFDQSC